MRLSEFNKLSKKEQTKVIIRKLKSIEKAGIKLAKLGIWNIPKDVKKKLKKGEKLSIWKAKQ